MYLFIYLYIDKWFENFSRVLLMSCMVYCDGKTHRKSGLLLKQGIFHIFSLNKQFTLVCGIAHVIIGTSIHRVTRMLPNLSSTWFLGCKI